MSLIEALVCSENASTATEAQQIVNDLRKAFYAGADPEELLADFGLEPDYVFDLL